MNPKAYCYSMARRDSLHIRTRYYKAPQRQKVICWHAFVPHAHYMEIQKGENSSSHWLKALCDILRDGLMTCLPDFLRLWAADYYLASTTAVVAICFNLLYRGFYLCCCYTLALVLLCGLLNIRTSEVQVPPWSKTFVQAKFVRCPAENNNIIGYSKASGDIRLTLFY